MPLQFVASRDLSAWLFNYYYKCVFVFCVQILKISIIFKNFSKGLDIYAHYAHKLGALTITAIGTSQEGSDTATIRQIALWCKMTGTDIHHIGDSGYVGMALPENITAYSIAIRGIRHTYHRMAQSINR